MLGSPDGVVYPHMRRPPPAACSLIFVARFPDRIDSATATAVRPLPRALQTPARDLVRLFREGIAPLRDPKTLALLLLLSVPIWLLESARFFLVGVGFGLHDSFDSLGQFAVANILVTAIANIGSSIPAVPGGIGLFELIARETLVLLPNASIDPDVAGGFAIVVPNNRFAVLVHRGRSDRLCAGAADLQ